MAVCLELEKLRVRSLDVDFNEISWCVKETAEDILDYDLQILRSESPEGPFDEISVPFQNQELFVDNSVPEFHRYRTLYYKIRVIEKATGEDKLFGPIAHEPEPDLVALELRKHINLLMREFVGRRCWVFPIRTFGPRCPNCWDKVLGKKKFSQCLTCFDTGFLRAYLRPIETWIQFDPSPKTQQQTNLGEQQQVNTTARLPYFPTVKPRDLIVEPENRRWRVTQQNQTEQGRAVVHQEIQLHEIPRSDIEFAIPLNMDTALKDLFLNPARNYTNPHNLQNFEDEEIPQIFSLYPTTYPPIKT